MKKFIMKLKYYKKRIYSFLGITQKSKSLPVPQKRYTATILFPSKEMMEDAMKHVK